MIHTIDMSKEHEVEELWHLQHVAYKVEAELIGFHGIPPLMDTLHTLRHCGETFYGYSAEEHLAGAISYTKEHDTVTICRMMVHPDHFRQGIAGTLLRYVEQLESCAEIIEVSTGTNNVPAIRLYEKNGFVRYKLKEVAPGIQITSFMKRMHRE